MRLLLLFVWNRVFDLASYVPRQRCLSGFLRLRSGQAPTRPNKAELHGFALIRRHETALVVVIGFAETDHAIFVIKSVRGRTHAVAAVKRVVLAFVEQRAVSTEVVGEPLIHNVTGSIDVTDHRLLRVGN